MTALLLAPAVLSLLVLAAHVLRAGVLFAVIALILLIPVLGLRRPWVPRMFQGVLVLGALEWVRTLLALKSARIAMEQPYGRMVAILGGVALFTLLAATLFEAPRVRRWYRGPGRRGHRAVAAPAGRAEPTTGENP
jgi:hypothetical protein